MPALPGPRPAPETHVLIPNWVRVLVILTTIPVWAIMVLYTLIVLDRLPGAEWTIFPSAVIAAVAPAYRVRVAARTADAPPDEPAAAAGGEVP
jgi:hypothetical protein